MASELESSELEVAATIRAAMISCVEEQEGRYYATEEGCQKLRDILARHGIKALVRVGADGRFEVRREVGVHICHWPGCGKTVPARLWGCREHWFALPKRIRDRIWEFYRPGQEVTKTPSADYLAAAREAQEWIASQTL